MQPTNVSKMSKIFFWSEFFKNVEKSWENASQSLAAFKTCFWPFGLSVGPWAADWVDFWFTARFWPKKIYPKFHQFWTTGWPVVAVFWSKKPFFCQFLAVFQKFRELAARHRSLTQKFFCPIKNAKFWYIEHGRRARNKTRGAAQRETVFIHFLTHS